jgi:Holliday junction resolvase-like predicted endonuclease
MVTPQEIGQAGERHAVEWLKRQGYRIDRWDTKSPGATDIDASNSKARILVQVKSAVAPGSPPALSGEDEKAIKARATKLSAEAWEARVTLSANLALSRAIEWRKLN